MRKHHQKILIARHHILTIMTECQQKALPQQQTTEDENYQLKSNKITRIMIIPHEIINLNSIIHFNNYKFLI